MNYYPHIEERKSTSNKSFSLLTKYPNEFKNIAFYQHQVYDYVFNGSISAPVHENCKLVLKYWNWEDHLQITGKPEFISSQIAVLPIGGGSFGDFFAEILLYNVKLLKEFILPL
ncbi:hypothetical protein F8M41_016935 [Gigaspora margarita]|uniref:Uncharacterized protein n=1 Tax=Gigaspora margarita TaxID=4874 RepID=A0A8H3WWR6_GIGMA|nr:hypothetical protein F8M41_016935 [Gigaspora margarita]